MYVHTYSAVHVEGLCILVWCCTVCVPPVDAGAGAVSQCGHDGARLRFDWRDQPLFHGICGRQKVQQLTKHHLSHLTKPACIRTYTFSNTQSFNIRTYVCTDICTYVYIFLL